MVSQAVKAAPGLRVKLNAQLQIDFDYWFVYLSLCSVGKRRMCHVCLVRRGAIESADIVQIFLCLCSCPKVQNVPFQFISLLAHVMPPRRSSVRSHRAPLHL